MISFGLAPLPCQSSILLLPRMSTLLPAATSVAVRATLDTVSPAVLGPGDLGTMVSGAPWAGGSMLGDIAKTMVSLVGLDCIF